MNQHLAGSLHEHTNSHDTFSVRFKKNLHKELLLALGFLGLLFTILRILFVGILIFIFEFKFTTIVTALVIPPLFIYFVGIHLTLLSADLVIIMTIISIFTLCVSEKGWSLIEWFGEIISSMFTTTAKVPSTSSLSDSLMGFVGFSVIVSFFLLVFL